MKRKPRVPTKPARIEKMVRRCKKALAHAVLADTSGKLRLRIVRAPRFRRGWMREMPWWSKQQCQPLMPPRATRWRRKLEAVGASL